MANKANEYPDRVLCPLIGSLIDAAECMETQDCADGAVKADALPPEYKARADWRKTCKTCKYHETD